MSCNGGAIRPNNIELVSGDLEVEPAMDQFIVAISDRPFGYLQCYDPDARWNTGFGAHPRGTRGIDQFIGEPDMIDRGHGSAFIRTFIDRLLATVRHASSPIPIRPTPARYAPMRRRDFESQHLVDTPDGPALLMVRDA